MLSVKIELKDEKSGKRAEIHLRESNNLEKLIIIQNVFRLFGIDTDVIDMAKTYNEIGKAYEAFFKEVNPIEPTPSEKIDSKKEIIKNQLIKGLITEREILDDTYKSVDDQPEYLRTGIKIKDDGTKLYQCFYKCYACLNKGKHFIYKDSETTYCHNCQHILKVNPAHPNGFPNRDTFGNFFRAGDFKDNNLNWE